MSQPNTGAPTGTNNLDAAFQQQLAALDQGGAGQSGQGGQTGTPPAEPKPIKVTIGGQEYQFKDESELSQALDRAFTQAPPPTTPAPTKTGSYVTGKEDDEPKLDTQQYAEFVRLMGENPIKALDYVDQIRFGTNLKSVIEDTQAVRQTIAAYQFRDAHPECPFTPQTAQILEATRRQLGVPFSPEGLEASYWTAVGRGAIRPQTPPQSGQPPQNQGYAQYGQGEQYGAVAPPPMVGRNTYQAPPDMNQRLEDMTKEQLADILTKSYGR